MKLLLLQVVTIFFGFWISECEKLFSEGFEIIFTYSVIGEIFAIIN